MYRSPANFANGNTRDRAGRLVTCEHGGRRVTRTEYRWQHHRPDGSMGRQAPQLPERCHREIRWQYMVHGPSVRHRGPLRGRVRGTGDPGLRVPDRRRDRGRFDRRGRYPRPERSLFLAGRASALCRGIARRAEPQEFACWTYRTRAVSATTAFSLTQAPAVRRTAFAVTSKGTSGPVGEWARRNWTGCWCSLPMVQPIGRVSLPERCANVCFGGHKRNRLFMASSHSLYTLYMNIQGAPGG